MHMKLIEKISEMRRYAESARSADKKISLVPTMGFFHEGHLSLMRAARKENDVVIASVFVNPAQFSPSEDFDSYPRDMERDKKLAEEIPVDVMFMPAQDEIYPENYSTYINVENLTKNLCGRTRPLHLRGVATIVEKLFNITRPHTAYFGQKDAQQAVVIKKIARDLDSGVQVKILSTVREKDMVAMSSRNAYLSADERKQAACLYSSLMHAEKLIAEGGKNTEKIISEMKSIIQKNPAAKIDYVEIVRLPDLAPAAEIKGAVLVAVAVFIGKARLIDNVVIGGDLNDSWN